ncbi:hypothetical protein [Paenibacillus medicaginis]|uniref:CdiI immunity protein domain-containing protein n=1 Tax=Paenibacillus medicaginis TaxID=1470560 RepID=A0ABV5BUH2_9BACL
MKQECFNEIKKAYYDENSKNFKEEMVVELFNAIDDLRESLDWIKTWENDFYNQVFTTEFGEIRRLDPKLKPWADALHYIFGIVNDGLNPRW